MTDDERHAPHPQCPQETCGRHQGRGACTSCEALEERDEFLRWVFGGWFFLLLGGAWWAFTWAYQILASWGIDAWVYITSEKGYRFVVPAIAAVIGTYVGLYAIVEARHERRANRAAFERATFLQMVTSGETAALTAAMKDFGRIQNVDVPVEPDFSMPLRWGMTERPNLRAFQQWAGSFFRQCTDKLCGKPIDLIFANLQDAFLAQANLQDAFLAQANLQDAFLHSANLQDADLLYANLQDADLTQANLQGADLRRANLQDVCLIDANLQDANLREVKNLTQPQLDKACADNTTKLPEHLILTPMSPEQRKLCAHFWPDSFKP